MDIVLSTIIGCSAAVTMWFGWIAQRFHKHTLDHRLAVAKRTDDTMEASHRRVRELTQDDRLHEIRTLELEAKIKTPPSARKAIALREAAEAEAEAAKKQAELDRLNKKVNDLEKAYETAKRRSRYGF